MDHAHTHTDLGKWYSRKVSSQGKEEQEGSSDRSGPVSFFPLPLCSYSKFKRRDREWSMSPSLPEDEATFFLSSLVGAEPGVETMNGISEDFHQRATSGGRHK